MNEIIGAYSWGILKYALQFLHSPGRATYSENALSLCRWWDEGLPLEVQGLLRIESKSPFSLRYSPLQNRVLGKLDVT
jgi:hypothetical protein